MIVDDEEEAVRASDSPQCTTCSGLLCDEPVSCPACLDGRALKRIRSKTANVVVHSDEKHCNLRRCQCLSEEAKLAASEKIIVFSSA